MRKRPASLIKPGLKAKFPKLNILGVYSIAMLAMLAYCYLGTVKEDSANFNVSFWSIISLSVYLFFSLIIIYRNRKPIYHAIFGNRKVLLLVVLAIVATLLTRTTIFLIPLLFALTAIGQDLRQLLKHYLAWSIVLFLTIMMMQVFGLIVGGEVAQEGSDGIEIMAQSLGFGNPNGAFAYLFSILVTAYVLLYKSSRKFLLSIFAVIVILAIYSQTLSRTGLICCLLVVLFAHTGRMINWKRVKRLLPSIFIGLTLGSVLLAVYYGEMGNTVNNLMSNRPYWWSIRVEDGALSNLLGNADSFAENYTWWLDAAPLDSFFLRIWFSNGLLILVSYFVFFRIWSKRVTHPMLIFGALVALLYGFSEYGILSNPAKNIILLLLMVPMFTGAALSGKRGFFRGDNDEK